MAEKIPLGRCYVMKILGDYLEHALEFERLADEAKDLTLKHSFLIRASTYRKLAAKRAYDLKLTKLPDRPPQRELNEGETS